MYKFVLPFAVGLFLTTVSSCNIYGVVAEDDVYVQGPSKLNLQEDPNDMTSFNAYRAGRQGRFQTQYNTPRRNANIGMHAGFGNPWGPTMGMHGGWGMHHGWGMNSWHNPWHNPWGPSWGMHGGWGMNSWHNPWHNPWGPTWGMHGGWGNNPWHGGGGFNGVHPGVNNPPQNVFRGPRRSYSSNSGRSSTYPNTMKSGMVQPKSGTVANRGESLSAATNSVNRNVSAKPARTVTPVERTEFVRPGVQSSTLAASRGGAVSANLPNNSINRANLQRNNLIGVNNTANNISRSNTASRNNNNIREIAPSNSQSARMNNQFNRSGAITTTPYRASSTAVRQGAVSRSQAQRSTGFQNSQMNSTIQNRSNLNRPGPAPARNNFDTPPRNNSMSRPATAPNRSNMGSPSRGSSMSSPSRGSSMSSPSRGSSMSSPSRGSSMSSPSRGGGSGGRR